MIWQLKGKKFIEIDLDGVVEGIVHFDKSKRLEVIFKERHFIVEKILGIQKTYFVGFNFFFFIGKLSELAVQMLPVIFDHVNKNDLVKFRKRKFCFKYHFTIT